MTKPPTGPPDGSPEPIAIVGMGCRFPMGANPEQYWSFLQTGGDAIREIPGDRWDVDAFYDRDLARPGKMATRWGGFLDRIDAFDWRAFGVSAREAKFIDPQHRLLLELGWEAFEDAGHPLESVAGRRIAVYVGIMWADYAKIQARTQLDGYTAGGSALAFAANRLSYFFDLRGPSVAVDMSCASSLFALHLACRSIRCGDAEMALAGGVNLIVSPDTNIAMSKAGILSPAGRCKTFDADADGFVRGEGAGLVLLKPLSRARHDRDRIYAVIRGTAAIHSGKTEWIMAPSRDAQERVLRAAYDDGSVDPADVDYVEVHGTGTRKGDPIEAEALGAVVGRAPGRAHPCIVGSVKTNIGHLDSAAGAASLIKTALALYHRGIPPSLHMTTLNPEIDMAGLGLELQQVYRQWPERTRPPIAGVTSLSFGGGNAHAVLEGMKGPSGPPDEALPSGPCLLPISARSPEALRALAQAYREHLNGLPAARLLAVCSTAARRRSHHAYRLAVPGSSCNILIKALGSFLDSPVGPETSGGRQIHPPRVAFVFAGQGPQWWGMGRDLWHCEPLFRQEIERCAEAMRAHAPWSLVDELRADEERSRLAETEFAQPTLFALQVALAALWRSWGVEPNAVVGHSVGEIAAATIAGVLDLEEGARIAVIRGNAMQRATGLGQMAQVALSSPQCEELIAAYGDGLAVAAENGPTTTVLSGDRAALAAALSELEARGVETRMLPVNYAFHSAQVESLRNALVANLAPITPQPPRLTLLSTLTGQPCTLADYDAEYWGRQMRERVRFAPAIAALLAEGCNAFIEIGPHPTLRAAISETMQAHGAPSAVAILPSLRKGEPERACMLSSLGTLYMAGQSVSWAAVFGDIFDWAPLPRYPWQRDRLWIDAPPKEQEERLSLLPPGGHPLLGRSVRLARPAGAQVWETIIDRQRQPYLEDHKVAGVVVAPASMFIEMAIAVAK